MKLLAFVTLLLTVPGCGAFRQALPPWARPAPAVTSPAETVASDRSATMPPVPPPAPSSAATSAPSAPLPPVGAPAPPAQDRPPTSQAAPAPAPVPVPVPATTATPSKPFSPSPPLTASLPPAEVRRLQDETNRRIEETERLLRQLAGRPLVPGDLEMLRLAQGLVEQARRALGGQEYERAANLAAKARTLADDLSTRR